MKFLGKKENLFKSTRFKLDIIASIFVFFILFSFSLVVYNLLTEDIIHQITPVFDYLQKEDQLNATQFFLDIQHQTLFLLVVSDIIIFVVSLLFFDRMVKRMLKPIEYMTNLQKSFATNVSHELRTPLSIMNMRGEILMSKIEKEETKGSEQGGAKFVSEVKDGAEVILKEISSLTNIIDDLLFEARIKYAEDKDKKLSQFELENILHKVYENQKHFKKGSVEFLMEFKNLEQTEYFEANPIHLERLLNNLISNSFKFTQRGTVKVSFQKYRQLNRNFLKLTVEDTGVGIGQADLPKISDRFYRGENVKNEISGTGIGLAIVKDIVNNYKWQFKIKSDKKSGTIISIDKILIHLQKINH